MFTQNENGGLLTVIVQEDGAVAPLAGATIRVIILDSGGVRTEDDVSAINLDTGACDIPLTAEILRVAGAYAYQLEINFPNGKRRYTAIDYFTVTKRL